MLNQFRRCCLLQGFLDPFKNAILTRNYARGRPAEVMKPLAVTNVRKRGRGGWTDPHKEEMDFSHIEDREIRETLQNVDMDLEPSLAHIGAEYDRYESEKNFLRKKIRRHKLYLKHFKDFEKREVSVLTYAEKENIRYLHENFPDRWTPERLAESFPVSIKGVEKLLKSAFRLTRPEKVVEHDEKVKKLIERIKAGEIPLTPDLQKKMMIREKILFQVGLIPENVKELTVPKKIKPLGEFAKLVATPERIREYEEAVGQAKREMDESRRKAAGFVEQMKDREIHAKEMLTLEEFEEKLKGTGSKAKTTSNKAIQSESDHVPQVQYLLDNMKEKRKRSDPVDAPEVLKPSEQGSFIRQRIQKFKPKPTNEEDLVEVKVERGEAYLYDSKTGYQKPYASEGDNADRIEIPKDKRIPGQVYQVGDSFYDENGEFMYRVI